jgi:hypothetical protein
MRKTIFIMLISFMLILLLLPTQAQDRVSETIYGLVTVDNAIVRVGPDFAYHELGILPYNSSVVVVGRAGDFISRWDGRQWVEIEYAGGRAWLYARLVRTSLAFNSIPPTGRLLPRDRNGRVPDEFDLSSDICSQWQGEFTLSGNFLAGDTQLTATYPTLQGTTIYSVIVISPTGFRTPFDSSTGTATIQLDRLPNHGGTYTWRVVPYWTNNDPRYLWQQICLLRTGGTFEKPETGFNRAGS